MAVLAPMPSASVSTATVVKPGFFSNCRKANFKSFIVCGQLSVVSCPLPVTHHSSRFTFSRFNSSTVSLTSVQPHPLMRVVIRHVREDDSVAHLQTFHHDDGADSRVAELDRHAHGLVAAVNNFENADRAFRLRVVPAFDVKDIVQPFEF